MKIARHFRRVQALVTPPDATHKVLRTREVFLASATLMDRRQIKAVAGGKRAWQGELWGFYDTIGECRFAARWIANAVSRCQLYIGLQQETTGEAVPVTLPDDPADDTNETAAARAAVAVLDGLYYGNVGQAEMLRKFALHLSVAGETYLVGIDDTTTERSWYVASNEELKVNSRGEATFLNPDTGLTMKLNPDNSTIIRLWIPHPLKGSEPDSPLAATLPVLREVKALSDHINATVESRLAGAGVLVLPHSVSLVKADPEATGPNSPDTGQADRFMEELTEAMVTPLSNPNDASAVVPIVIRVPDEVVGNIQHLSFATELTGKASDMRKDALDRFAAGADLPREVVTGTGSANHWGAWQIEESSIKLHIAPLASVICDALTQQYLWPALRAMGIADPERFVIWFDASALYQRPNKAAEARELYNLGMLSPDALLRENGFGKDDAPTPAERRAWLAMRAALGSPDLAVQILNMNPAVLDTTTNSDQPGPGETTTDRALPDTLELDPPSVTAAAVPDPAHAWWIASVEQAVIRALDLAGGRLYKDTPRSERTENSPLRTVRRWDVHTVLTVDEDQAARALSGAFTTAEATFDDPCVTRTVHTYCTDLLISGRPHRRVYLEAALAEAGCTPGRPRQEAEHAR